MKTLFRIIVFALILTSASRAAFLAPMVWEVRTTGAADNGGGFDPVSGTPGTDYSQQDSPQVTYTDLVIDPTTDTNCTSVATPFTSAHVGNVINITNGTGFTVQRVQIISVSTGIATCDKSLGTLASTGGNGKLGGGLLTVGGAAALVVAGNTTFIKAGTYTISADLAFATAGTTTAIIWWRGYKTTRGDLDSAGGSRIPATDLPKIATTNVTDQITSAGAHQIWSNIAVASTCTDAGGAWNATGGNLRFIRCQIVNSQANTNARAITSVTTNPVIYVGCRFSATTTATIGISVQVSTRFIGCYLSGGVTTVTCSEYAAFDYTTISGFGTSGISFGSASRLFSVNNCTIYAAGTNGILVTTIPTSGYVSISNTIIGGCTNGINNNTGGSTNGVTLVANQFYACTNNIVGLTDQADVTSALTASLFNIDNDTDPWVAKASADFNLAAAAAAKSAAYPGVFDDPSGTNVMQGYPDIGAVRHVDPSGSGGQRSYSF